MGSSFTFICSTSFLSFRRIIQRHCNPQFTLYTGINVWPCQAWLTVPVYICVLLFFFLWSHMEDLQYCPLNINQCFDQQIQLTHARPKHALHAPSKNNNVIIIWTPFSTINYACAVKNDTPFNRLYAIDAYLRHTTFSLWRHFLQWLHEIGSATAERVRGGRYQPEVIRYDTEY